VEEKRQVKLGFLYGTVAYGTWGFIPLYFAAVSFVPAKEILVHRIIWSAILLNAIVFLFGRKKELFEILRQPRLMGLLSISTVLIALNWYLFIYGVSTGQVLQGSLAYFILPIVNVFAGIFIFKEKIRLPQALALGLAALGVLVQIISLGDFPTLAIVLAVTFCAYGVVRKQTNVDGILGLTVETTILTPLAIGCLIFWGLNAEIAFASHGLKADVLISLSGIITTIPLICFAESMRRLSFITVGFLQYLSPSVQLLLAIFYFGEEFTWKHGLSFGLIWLGLIILVSEAIWTSQRKSVEKVVIEQDEEDRLIVPQPALAD
jgi:chloramphenicol-sensitive protein RarD